jgi:AcrR family transcriptional regulator
MSPRPYRLGARQAARDETRARIVAAARAMIAAPEGIRSFTIDAVARHAGVARMTIYYQFASKRGLIDAVFDSLAIVRYGVMRLVDAMAFPDPEAMLASFVATFAEVWQADRLVIRRLKSLAGLDPEFADVWNAREKRRQFGMRHIATHVAASRPAAEPFDVQTVADVLYAVIAFDAFDAIAGPDRPFEAVAPLVLELARQALGYDGARPVGGAPPPPAPRRRPRRTG